MHSFIFDMPPSVNQRLKPTRFGRFVNTPLYQEWLDDNTNELCNMIYENKHKTIVKHGIKVHVELCFSDNRRRDLDNWIKPILDIFTQSKYWSDDSLIDELIIKRGANSSPAIAKVQIYF